MSDLSKKPKHVAIIMDGNGRWARQRRRPRFWGHIRGAANVKKIVYESIDQGLDSLTLYAFSTENWSRPDGEVSVLFRIMEKYLIREREEIIKKNVRCRFIGDISKLSPHLRKLLLDTTEYSKDRTGMVFNIAFNYGGRQEIVNSVNQFIEKNPGKEISEEDIKEHLSTKEFENLDLLIRTAGDERISNFLLWQMAYAELCFTDTKWPEFSINEYRNILNNFETRERRFGGWGQADKEFVASQNQ